MKPTHPDFEKARTDPTDPRYVAPTERVPNPEPIGELPSNVREEKSPCGLFTHRFRVHDEIQICGHKLSRHPGAVCGQTILRRNGRCRSHGKGTSYRDVRTADGKWHRDHHPLRDAEKRADADDRLMDLRKGLALYDLRMEELSAKIEDGDIPIFRDTVKSLTALHGAALKAGDLDKIQETFNELKEVVESGVAINRVWNELLSLAERRQKRAEEANKVAIKGETMLRTSAVKALLARILKIVHQECPQDAFRRVDERVSRELLEGRKRAIIKARKAGPDVLPGVQGEGA